MNHNKYKKVFDDLAATKHLYILEKFQQLLDVYKRQHTHTHNFSAENFEVIINKYVLKIYAC